MLRSKLALLLTMLMFLFSCSSMKKSAILGAFSGAAIGGTSGMFIGETQGDKKANSLSLGSLIAGIGSWVGYYFYNKNVKVKKEKRPENIYTVPAKNLPDHLKNKFKGQKVLEYIVPEERTSDGKIIQEHKIWQIVPLDAPN